MIALVSMPGINEAFVLHRLDSVGGRNVVRHLVGLDRSFGLAVGETGGQDAIAMELVSKALPRRQLDKTTLEGGRGRPPNLAWTPQCKQSSHAQMRGLWKSRRGNKEGRIVMRLVWPTIRCFQGRSSKPLPTSAMTGDQGKADG